MFVRIIDKSYKVILEDQGAYLEFLQSKGKPAGELDVRFYPPGGNKPDLSNSLPPVDARGCLGVVRYKDADFLLIAVPPVNSVGLGSDEVEQVEDVIFFDVSGNSPPEACSRLHTCFHLHQVLTSGAFYYSKSFDLTTRFENRIKAQEHRDAACDPQPRTDSSFPPAPPFLAGTPEFTWNHYLLEPLAAFRGTLTAQERACWDSRFFMLPVIQGLYGECEVAVGAEKLLLTVVSRRGWGRAGTRFKKRGIDANGNVGNFAETETIIQTSTKAVAFTQIRGSVPLKWIEHLRLAGPVNLSIASPLLPVSLPPFLAHMRSLIASYSRIHILSLLSNLHSGSLAPEAQLGDAYQALCDAGAAQDEQVHERVVYQQYSIHKNEMLSGQAAHIPAEIAEAVGGALEEFGAAVVAVDEATGKMKLEKEQQGVFRVNCRDCLDRSNLGEFSLSTAALEKQMSTLGLPPFAGSALEKAHRRLWAKNGDAISQIYAGSPAMNSRFIRRGIFDKKQELENAVNSERRVEQCLVHDRDKNRAIEILTGQYSKQEPPPTLIRVDSSGRPLPSSSPLLTAAPPPPSSLSSPPHLMLQPLALSSPDLARSLPPGLAAALQQLSAGSINNGGPRVQVFKLSRSPQ
ncbi:hypothetical protein JCM6882_009634 [Rhodosporidiobolus microsporus]